MHNSLLEVCQFECCRFHSDAFSMSYSAKDDTNGITARNETFSRLRNVRMKLCLISCRNHHRCQAHTHSLTQKQLTINGEYSPMIGTFVPLNEASKHCYRRAFVHKTFYQFDSCLKAIQKKNK